MYNSLNNKQEIENKLLRMKKLSDKLKALEAEYDMLKEQVVSEYFSRYEEYRNDKGLLLASYKSYVAKQFQGTKFKNDNPNLYDTYTEEKTIYKFLLSK